MTALSDPRAVISLETGLNVWRTFGVAADKIIYPGALVAINAAGYLVPASAVTTLRVVGVAAPKRDQMNRDGVVNSTDLAAGAASCEVAGGLVLMKNGTTALTIADVGNTCYLVDDQTVAKNDGGTAQVTRGDFVFSTTDPIGLTVDGLSIFVPSNTSDDQTVADFVAYWNAHPVAKTIATASSDISGAESYGILTFLDSNVHTVVAYSPATADVTGITNTTAAVAATRPVAGKVWLVDSRGVFVAVGLPS